MLTTDKLIRATDFAVFVKGMRGDWVPHPDTGRIYSNRSGDFLKTREMNGYLRLPIGFPYDGRQRQSSVTLHRALWVLCRGIPQDLQAEVDHIDGDRANNCLENLRLIPAAENTRNRITYEDAEEMRRLRAEGLCLREIAEAFHVSKTTVRNVVLRHTHAAPSGKMLCGRL